MSLGEDDFIAVLPRELIVAHVAVDGPILALETRETFDVCGGSFF